MTENESARNPSGPAMDNLINPIIKPALAIIAVVWMLKFLLEQTAMGNLPGALVVLTPIAIIAYYAYKHKKRQKQRNK